MSKQIVVVGLFLSCMFFQNCSGNKFSPSEQAELAAANNSSKSESETVDSGGAPTQEPKTPQTGAEPADEPQVSEPVAPPPCKASGQRVDPAEFNGNVYIYYRKCDNEIQLWKNMLKNDCCSKSVSIVDDGVYADTQCASGRFYGKAYCD